MDYTAAEERLKTKLNKPQNIQIQKKRLNTSSPKQQVWGEEAGLWLQLQPKEWDRDTVVLPDLGVSMMKQHMCHSKNCIFKVLKVEPLFGP